MERTLYEILGVTENADQTEIKKAYRNKAVLLHPDHNTESDDRESKEAEFKTVGEAYSILSNPEKKQAYDNRNNNNNMFGDAFNVFSNMRNHFTNNFKRRPTFNIDIQIHITLGIADFVLGCSYKLDYDTVSLCKVCKGACYTSFDSCDKCNGSGFTVNEQVVNGGRGRFRNIMPCGCMDGKIPKDLCTECNGSGIAIIKKNINIPIECDAKVGSVIRFAGMGNCIGTNYGDLYVMLNIVLPDNNKLCVDDKEFIKKFSLVNKDITNV